MEGSTVAAIPGRCHSTGAGTGAGHVVSDGLHRAGGSAEGWPASGGHAGADWEVLGLPAGRIGIKATTTEKHGFVGRSEGIAAMAIATVSFGACEPMASTPRQPCRPSPVLFSDAARRTGLTIATAESCTGGMVAAALTEHCRLLGCAGCGFVTYSNAAKTAMLVACQPG